MAIKRKLRGTEKLPPEPVMSLPGSKNSKTSKEKSTAIGPIVDIDDVLASPTPIRTATLAPQTPESTTTVTLSRSSSTVTNHTPFVDRGQRLSKAVLGLEEYTRLARIREKETKKEGKLNCRVLASQLFNIQRYGRL